MCCPIDKIFSLNQTNSYLIDMKSKLNNNYDLKLMQNIK